MKQPMRLLAGSLFLLGLAAASQSARANDLSDACWSETAASNTCAVPNGLPANTLAANLYGVIHEIMGALKRDWDRVNPTVTSAGTNTITLTYTVAPAAYVQGQTYCFVAGGTNTGAATLNVNGLGAKNITKRGTTALTGSEILANEDACVQYDGVEFQLVTAGSFSGASTNANNNFSANQTIVSNASGAAENPQPTLFRSNNGSANDNLGGVAFTAKNSAGTTLTVAQYLGFWTNVSAGSEAGGVIFQTVQSGALANAATLAAGLQVGSSPTGGDKGAGTINAKAGYFDNGVAFGAPSIATKTGDYTAQATDCGTTLIMNSASAHTFTLPADATAGNGCAIAFRDQGTGVVSIARAGSDTLASGGSTALATLALSQGDAGMLTADGAGGGIWWWTGTRHYDSGQQTITAAGSLTLAHGLGVKPSQIFLYLHNTTAELNYSIGDEILINPVGDGGTGNNRSTMLLPDASNLNIRFGSGTSSFVIPNKSTGVMGLVTNANWTLIARANLNN